MVKDDMALIMEHLSAARATLEVFRAPEPPEDGGQVLRILTDLMLDDPELEAAIHRVQYHISVSTAETSGLSAA